MDAPRIVAECKTGYIACIHPKVTLRESYQDEDGMVEELGSPASPSPQN
ncbi:TPA: hypothetical protein QHT08_004146 [Escherichia coli]|nr:hypothetical protein [Escherichia coli]